MSDSEIESVTITPSSTSSTSVVSTNAPEPRRLTNDLFYKDFKVQALETKDDELPYTYYSPESDGKVTWHCAIDQNGKITSVFAFLGGLSTGESDKRVSYVSLEDANKIKAELIANGWKKMEQPKVKAKIPGEDRERELNRRELRYLKRKMERNQKKLQQEMGKN
jgi:hypothetical protein